MASGKAKNHGRKRVIRRRWFVAGLAVFLAFDVALVVVALNGTKPSSHAGSVVDVPPVVEPVEVKPPVVEPVETTPPVVETVPPTRIIAVLDGSTAWRSVAGSCPGTQAAPEVTKDGGDTWTVSDAWADTGASAIVAINAISTTQASLVTLAAEDCAPQLHATFVSGTAWKEYPERLSANWFIDPANRAQVQTPSGAVAAPCPSVISIAPRSDTAAAVLCATGSLFRTSEAGTSWGLGIELPGAMALGVAGKGYLVAAGGQAGCAGVQLLSTSEALDGLLTGVSCRDATFSAGEVALAGSESEVWLWAGASLSRSSDGGVSWQ
jgi:hypothetical protein